MSSTVPDILPIGVDHAGGDTFLCVVTPAGASRFSRVLERRAELLRMVKPWIIRLPIPNTCPVSALGNTPRSAGSCRRHSAPRMSTTCFGRAVRPGGAAVPCATVSRVVPGVARRDDPVVEATLSMVVVHKLERGFGRAGSGGESPPLTITCESTKGSSRVLPTQSGSTSCSISTDLSSPRTDGLTRSLGSRRVSAVADAVAEYFAPTTRSGQHESPGAVTRGLAAAAPPRITIGTTRPATSRRAPR